MATLHTTINQIDLLLNRAKGVGHVHSSKPCQDYCYAKKIKEEVTLLAVADGHGGAQYIYSDQGSYTACHTLAKLVAESIEDVGTQSWCQTLKRRFHDDVLRLHEEKDVMLYGTTLLFAIITPDDIIAGQLGDGAILLMNEKQSLLHKPVHPKQSSLTHSMVETHSAYYWSIERYDRHFFTDVMLCTDGIFDPLKTEAQLTFYALGLKERFLKNDISNVYDFYGQNIMDYTFDDCTVIFASLSHGDTFDIEEGTLITTQKGLFMYETKDAIIRVRDAFVPLKQADYLLTPTKVEQSGDYYVYYYPKLQGYDLFMNHYYFDDIIADGQQDPQALLAYYLSMDALNAQLEADGLTMTHYFYKSLVIEPQQHLCVFLDAIKGDLMPWHSPLLGTLIVNDLTYPLLDIFNDDGFSPMIFQPDHTTPFYCTVKKEELDLIGIYNASKEPWHILELDLDCTPGMVLPLNRLYHIKSGKTLMVLIPSIAKK